MSSGVKHLFVFILLLLLVASFGIFESVIAEVISGYVYDDTLAPMPFVTVEARDANDPWAPAIQQISTDLTGYYEFNLTPPLSVNVKCKTVGSPFVPVFYPSVIELADAMVLNVQPGSSFTGTDFYLQRGALISGNLSVDGVPATGDGWIDIYSIDLGRWLFNASLHTNYNFETGEWTVTVPPGSYKFWGGGESAGIGAMKKYYNDTYDFNSATVFNLIPDDILTGLDFPLTTVSGSISGDVVYTGPQTGNAFVWVTQSPGNDYPSLISVWYGPPGPFDINVPLDIPLFVKAFLDVDGDFIYDPGEPFGEYLGGQAPPIILDQFNTTLPGVFIEMFDPCPPGSIMGTVTDTAGNPLPDIPVRVEDSGHSGQWGSTVTDISGHYCIGSLPDRDDYYVIAQGNSAYATQVMPWISVVGGGPTVVDFSLPTAGSISGVVTEADGVTPIEGIGINVFEQSPYGDSTWYGSATSGIDGTYTVYGIPAGDWHVEAKVAQSGFVDMYYDGAYFAYNSTAVPVSEGQDTTGIDFALSLPGSISGNVQGAVGPVPGVKVQIEIPGGDGDRIADTTTDVNGDYTLTGLPPTGLLVRVMPAEAGLPYINQYYTGAYYRRDALLVIASEGGTTGINFYIEQGAVLEGSMTDQGVWPGNLSKVHVDLYSVSLGRWIFDSSFDDGVFNDVFGTWRLVVPPDTYKLWADPEGNAAYPRQYYNNTYLFDSALDIVVTGTETHSGLDFDFNSNETGTVEGGASYSGNQNGFIIVWITPNPGNDWPNMTAATSSEMGTYMLTAPQGTWYVKAFMDVDGDFEYDSGEPFGEYISGAVGVSAGGTTSPIDITLLDASPPLTFDLLSHDSTDPMSVVYGDPATAVHWTAGATGGSGQYEYRFWAIGPETGNVWQIAQNWGPSNVLNWMVDKSDKGLTTVSVVIRDTVNGEVVSGTYSNFEVQVTYSPLVFNSVGHDSTDPLVVAAGSPEQSVQWTASATGGSGQYEYRFWMVGPETGNAWQIVRPYGPSNQYNWMVDATDVGFTTIVAVIRDTVTGEVVSGMYSDFEVQVTYDPLLLGSLGHDSTDPLTVGVLDPEQLVQWTANATGGSGNYEYRFWMVGPETGNTWQIVQPYGPSNQYNWMVDQTDEGMTMVVAVIKDTVTGEVVSGTYSDFEVQVTYSPLVFDSLGHDSISDPLTIGVLDPEQPVQWTASATGGSGQYEYRFWMVGPETGNAWQIVRPYDISNHLDWMVDATDAGQTTVTVIIRDLVTGEKVSGTYSNFTVQVQ